MAYKEIVTKAIVGKGRKKYKNSYQVEALQNPSTILGCWIINHLITVGDKHLKNPYITRA